MSVTPSNLAGNRTGDFPDHGNPADSSWRLTAAVKLQKLMLYRNTRFQQRVRQRSAR